MVKELGTTRKDGTRCEAVLWDLAGQPDYRLIHALSIQDADVALILFDPTNSRDPLGSAQYWLRQLPPKCPKILVAARVDRGHPVLTHEELAAFCQRQGIAGGWIATSAASGLGLDELLTRIKQVIPWDEKPAVSTDAVFKRIKDFVLTLKERHGGSPQRKRERGGIKSGAASDSLVTAAGYKQIIFKAAELRAAIENDFGGKRRRQTRASSDRSLATSAAVDQTEVFTEAQLLTAVRHLSSQGFVRLLTLSTGEERVLLLPEFMNNLAASMVLEARRNPRGLGAIEEHRLFDNSYRFRELESLSKTDQALLLDGTIAAFLANRLSYRCFREEMGEIKLLVFPELMNLKKPRRDDLDTEDGASYILTGSTDNTFAGLVVLLGYTNLFLRTDQAHDAAWFESNRHEICGVRQVRDDNERTLVLLFGRNVSAGTRTVFEGLVEQMLSRRDVNVRRLRPVKCAKCGTAVDRAVMARRLKQGKSTVGCEECYQPIILPPDEPLAMKPAQREVIAREGAVAERRTKFEEVLYELQRLAEAEKLSPPTCFISYAWGNPDHDRWIEHILALDLEKAGIKVILDRWDARPGSTLPNFVDRIEKADRVLVVGTKDYRRRYENQDRQTGSVVALEMKVVWARLTGPAEQRATVVPLLREGELRDSLPPVLHAHVASDFRDDDRYFDTALDLMLGLYGIPPRHPAAMHWKQQLSVGEFQRKVRAQDVGDDEPLLDNEVMQNALKRVGREALTSAFNAQKPVVIEQNGQLVWLYPDGTRQPYIPEIAEQTGAGS